MVDRYGREQGWMGEFTDGSWQLTVGHIKG